MEIEQLGFSVDADPQLWIPVPLEYPYAEWPDVHAWAHAITVGVLEGIEGVTTEVEGQFLQLAHAIADSEALLPDPQARFWYFPVFGGPMHLCHLYASPIEMLDGLSLVESAAGGADEQAPQRVEEQQIPGFSQSWCITLLDELPPALRDLELSAGDPEVGGADGSIERSLETGIAFGSIRFIGEQSGIVLMLEASGTNIEGLAGMKDDLAALFGTIRVDGSVA
ncbi:hypothetical protein [Glaciibacter psychrotolerans]|uniref:Uncharacterized protein n=1 Tax=Glaciibacter psychrotolerans TaxID=670054 RepID=A0A7Z0J811_9MICO|nr:hypothetical protein [Leifsonia psychrotolerans]NYJ21439.1 hypothetical protein [Leifsonia psychrotolerans]